LWSRRPRHGVMKVIYPHVEPVPWRLLVQVVTRVRIQG
jgi:hypothetical protein